MISFLIEETVRPEFVEIFVVYKFSSPAIGKMFFITLNIDCLMSHARHRFYINQVTAVFSFRSFSLMIM